jgi:hypothetical protein
MSPAERPSLGPGRARVDAKETSCDVLDATERLMIAILGTT